MNDRVQVQRRVDDAGEKIGGARKDWLDRALSVDDLDAMTGDEAIANVVKDHVWPQPDWANLIGEGMSAEAAALAKIVRDNLAKTPNFPRGVDPDDVRRSYVRMVGMLRDRLMAAKASKDVIDLYEEMVKTLGGADALRNDPAVRTTFFSVYRTRTCPFYVSYKDQSKARKMLSEGFPEKVPAWRKGVRTYPAAAGGVILVKSGRQISEPMESEEAAFAWLKEQSEKKTAEKPSGKPEEPKRPHLAELERVGLPDHRNGVDITSEDFITTFGFRAVEFGLWLPDDERQDVLNLAYDALHDLADVLGWPPSAMSLDGTLAVAFGARGSGNALAHYEPGRRVINMTRLRGAGALAHEYAHAFDHFSGDVGHEGSAQDVRSGTGWRDRRSDVRDGLNNLLHSQAQAWFDIEKAVFNTPLTRERAIERARERHAHLVKQIAKYEKERAEQLELPVEKRNRKYVKDIEVWVERQKPQLRNLEAIVSRLETADDLSDLGSEISAYAKEARKLCGKSGEYWLRPTEMFARAFESYVYDKLVENGRKSDYLVNGVEEDRFQSERYRGNPYPTGKERLGISAAMDNLVREMTPVIVPERVTAPGL